jgi:hypothetical protein
MTLQEQLEQAKARRDEMLAGRPKVYRAWDDTWATFHENPTAYHEAYARLLAYDIEKNKVSDEVERLRTLVEDPDITAAKAESKAFWQKLLKEKNHAV